MKLSYISLALMVIAAIATAFINVDFTKTASIIAAIAAAATAAAGLCMHPPWAQASNVTSAKPTVAKVENPAPVQPA